MRREVALVALAAALGGCADAVTLFEDVRDQAQLATAGVAMRACDQSRALFTYPSAAFEGFLPPGVRPAPVDPSGATTSVLFLTSSCADAEVVGGPTAGPVGPYAETWGLLLVEVDANVSGGDEDGFPLGLFTTSPAVAEVYGGRGLAPIVRVGEVTLAQQPALPGFHAWRATARASGETFEVDTQARLAPDEAPEGVLVTWLGTPEALLGSYATAWTPGERLGEGPAALRHEGNLLEQPPRHAGTAHHVRGVDVTVGPFVPLLGG